MTTPEIEELKILVEQKYGRVLGTSTDFEEFSFFLSKEMNVGISASTLKRLYGYVNDSHKPRVFTLDILSQYLGHKNFSDFVLWLKTSTKYNSSFFNAGQITSNEIKVGTQLAIGWSPNRLIKLSYLGDSLYEVTYAENSKLQVGDRFVTGCFIKGQPIFLPFIERNGKRTPPFVGGRNGGLTIANIL